MEKRRDRGWWGDGFGMIKVGGAFFSTEVEWLLFVGVILVIGVFFDKNDFNADYGIKRF